MSKGKLDQDLATDEQNVRVWDMIIGAIVIAILVTIAVVISG